MNIVPLLLIFIQIEQYGCQQCKGCIVVSKMIHDLFFCSKDTAPQQTTGALSAAYHPLPLHPDPLTPLQPPSQGDEERPSPTSAEGVVLQCASLCVLVALGHSSHAIIQEVVTTSLFYFSFDSDITVTSVTLICESFGKCTNSIIY